MDYTVKDIDKILQFKTWTSLSIYKEIKKIDPELGAILMYDK